MRRGLGAGLLRVHGGAIPADDVIVEGVLEVRLDAVDAIEPTDVGLVVAEQEGRVAFHVQSERTQLGMACFDRARGRRPRAAVCASSPFQDQVLRNQTCGSTWIAAVFGAAVVDRHPHQHVVRPGLGVLDEDVEVAVVVEDAGVEQLVLRLVLAAAPVLLDQPRVGKRALRVLVEHLQVGVRRRGVEVVVELLDVLAVVALAVGQAEEALLEDRVLAVPQGQRQAEALLVVAEAGQAVLAPAVGAAAGVVVGEVVPGVAVGAVVLADGAPLALAQVRPPPLPRLSADTVFL